MRRSVSFGEGRVNVRGVMVFWVGLLEPKPWVWIIVVLREDLDECDVLV